MNEISCVLPGEPEAGQAYDVRQFRAQQQAAAGARFARWEREEYLFSFT